MAITDLTGTTWTFNQSVERLPSTTFYINFSCALLDYSAALEVSSTAVRMSIKYGATHVYTNGWASDLARTITIIDGIDVTNSSLISWLESNAALQRGGSLTISYDGNTIHTSTSFETFKLKTAGKYLIDDITIVAEDVGSLLVTYDGVTVISTSGTVTGKLKTSGKFLTSDVIIVVAEESTTPSVVLNEQIDDVLHLYGAYTKSQSDDTLTIT